MYAKKLLKRKCSVRGCKNTDTYAISLTREFGNSVIMCKSCAAKVVGAIEEIKPIPDAHVPHDQAPPLFFNRLIKRAVEEEEVIEESPVQEEAPEESVAEEPVTEEAIEDTPDTDDVDGYACPYCEQVCKSELGLQKHISAKHKDVI